MIGSRIKEARKARKQSQQWLADEVGVLQSSVSAWEIGRSEPTTENLSRIAQVLRVSHDWLATGRGGMHLSATPVQVNDHVPLNADEAELLDRYRTLGASTRQALMVIMRSLTK
ncbi:MULTISPECIES: helix-turn-helix domain-containing protein [Chromobacterium]|uniref:HTH cro/C1-type domain-containing protein n=1 Tax=Chromobacterium vaccinii TaxID=1108595 RepID=A0A1D9LC99_9NEIS|nr:helix-turn-helix domain-containing protein [Chromobacterium violaceum]AOZ48897.1 hypothetical protein BKX93_02055 [Chromobacterium vaccinii]MBA8735357.1 helix-turn-helix domain-containing protein [Chromobacterium violaceum]